MQFVDPGQKARMDILRRDAERNIFEKLRNHNWSAKIEREFPDGLSFPLNVVAIATSLR